MPSYLLHSSTCCGLAPLFFWFALGSRCFRSSRDAPYPNSGGVPEAEYPRNGDMYRTTLGSNRPAVRRQLDHQRHGDGAPPLGRARIPHPT